MTWTMFSPTSSAIFSISNSTTRMISGLDLNKRMFQITRELVVGFTRLQVFSYPSLGGFPPPPYQNWACNFSVCISTFDLNIDIRKPLAKRSNERARLAASHFRIMSYLTRTELARRWTFCWFCWMRELNLATSLAMVLMKTGGLAVAMRLNAWRAVRQESAAGLSGMLYDNEQNISTMSVMSKIRRVRPELQLQIIGKYYK